MKVKRYKQVKKILGFYENNFGFREPYQVLIDGTFCFAALQNKINISYDLPRYIQGEIKFVTTACTIIEMEKFGSKVSGALIILKKFGVHKCGHEKQSIPGADCLLSMIGDTNENHYILATNDTDLENKVRAIPGVPLLYLHSKTPVLENPSIASVAWAKEKNAGLGSIEKKQLEKLKEMHGLLEEPQTKKKKKKLKGANPLSCLKSKKKNSSLVQNRNGEDSPIKKTKRKRIRYPEHVKEEMRKGNLILIKKLPEEIKQNLRKNGIIWQE